MYDLIGDIHGYADELMELLERLGYDRRFGHYAHPDRTAVFVGDFIDRGPQIREVLQLVRPMIDAGAARSVMGNHELNAISFHTRDPEHRGEFLRKRRHKNIHQHWQTLKQLTSDELYDAVEWFRTLPLWLDLDEVRVAHACWHPASIALIRDELRRHEGVTTSFLQQANRDGDPLFLAVNIVLKGPEVELPGGVRMVDKDGMQRRMVRIRWFEQPGEQSLAGYMLPDQLHDDTLNAIPLPAACHDRCCPYPESAPPVFFGHYWLPDRSPSILAANVACLDYSVAKHGQLCAYRFQGEERLTNDHFVTVATRSRD